MQQFQSQSKSENKSTSNLAKMMAQMDKKKRKEEIPEEYFELLKKPRSKRYLELVGEQMQISEDMEALAIQIRALEDAMDEVDSAVENGADDVSGITVSESRPKEWWEEDEEEETAPVPEKEWWEEESEETEDVSDPESSWTQEQIDLTEINARAEQKKKELQAKKEELEKQYKALGEKLEESKKQLERELPVGTGRLGVIYPACNTKKLLDYGVIAVPGSPYFSEKDLLDQVNPQSEQEKKQWCKGNEYYDLHVNQRRENVLVIEIYLFAICVVYEQGTTVVYRDDN